MKKLLQIFFLIFVFNSYACECEKILWAEWSEEGIKESIINNKIIIIGELISSNEKSYKLKVIESFKGGLKKGEILEGSYLNTCSGRPHPKRTGKWIFYGFYGKNENTEILNYSSCGPTRSLNYTTFYSKEDHIRNWKKELKILNSIFNKKVEFEVK
ncbi:hypothetical protein [Wenyingzhuangia sp. IMCC45574]